MKRDPKAKPGELRAAWSTASKHGYSMELGGQRGDLVYARGDGVSRADSHLLHGVLATKRWRSMYAPGESPFDPSFLEELHARGYDLTTLRFSINKRGGAA